MEALDLEFTENTLHNLENPIYPVHPWFKGFSPRSELMPRLFRHFVPTTE
jgi:hypothetical protein